MRMKAGREHRVPLSERALEILATVEPLRTGPDDFIFPDAKKGRPRRLSCGRGNIQGR